MSEFSKKHTCSDGVERALSLADWERMRPEGTIGFARGTLRIVSEYRTCQRCGSTLMRAEITGVQP